jgi:biotin synthase
LEKDQIIALLKSGGIEKEDLFRKAAGTRDSILGKVVYFRGLIEFSNICSKDCYYCGIRKSNEKLFRYDIPDSEILEACRFALDHDYGSVVLQSGEISSPAFTLRVEKLVEEIKTFSGNKLGITLSCGEQSAETYRRWFQAGAHRYLLRIETSDRVLYSGLHPGDNHHSYEKRLAALMDLKENGYQVGTGVMIGLPLQTLENLADDLLFFRETDIDMCGMGPYIEHEDTPLYAHREHLMPKMERFELTLKMIAILRLIMPDINIAASTALQSIVPEGREMAVSVGANIIMPNLTPSKYRYGYRLYENKPGLDWDASETDSFLKNSVLRTGCRIGFGEWGDSLHFRERAKGSTTEETSEN